MNTRRSLANGTALLLSLVSLGAVVGGIMLIVEPTGKTLDLSLKLLAESPFSDYLLPGIMLLAVFGVLGMGAAFLVFKNHRFAGMATILLGAALVIWISAEVYWFGWESWLLPVFMTVGVVEVILGVFIEATNHENWKWFNRHHHGTHAH
ncbi:hypothetical protein ACWM35_14015 [Neobacillus sp. K501]